MAYLYQECTESPIKKIKLEAIVSKKDDKVKRQHIIASVKNKLAAVRDNVLGGEEDIGNPIVPGCFNIYG